MLLLVDYVCIAIVPIFVLHWELVHWFFTSPAFQPLLASYILCSHYSVIQGLKLNKGKLALKIDKLVK